MATEKKAEPVKKEDASKPDAKKIDAPKDEVKIPKGPSLEDLALAQTPTVEEVQAKVRKEKSSSNVEPATASTQDDDSDSAAISLEEIAATQQLNQQRNNSVEYRLPAALGPQSAYQSNSQTSNPTSVYRPSQSNAPYTTANQQQRELPQRGGIAPQYDRSDIERTIGKSAADELLEERRRAIHGDRGLFGKYDNRR